MNSHEEISVYKEPQALYNSPTLNRGALGYSYDFPEKQTKKEKKWSIGSLFRRKKDIKSESSSEEDRKRGFLGRRRRKNDTSRRKKPPTLVAFDHVVVSPKNSLRLNANNTTNGYNYREDLGVLSDPSGGFMSYSGRNTSNVPSPELHKLSVSGSADSITKKSRKEIVKARAAARRTTLNHDSSSDEDSQHSSMSLRIRSDESLAKPQEVLLNRKSRAARTERYLKRHSKDGENPHNYLRLSKSDAEHSPLIWKCSDENRSPSRSPLVPKNQHCYSNLSSELNPNLTGLSTIPPSHVTSNRYRISNSTSNPSYKPPLSMNEYNNSTRRSVERETNNNLRSVSYDGIHQMPNTDDSVLHVQFPISRAASNRSYRNYSLIDTSQVNSVRQPPQPPPRDPNRTVNYSENTRPNTYYFENNFNIRNTKSFNLPYSPTQQVGIPLKPNQSFNFHPSHRSSSEQQLSNAPFQLQTSVRPSSTTPEPKPRRYTPRRYETRTNPEIFNYITDKNPRSRKPILVEPENNNTENNKESPTPKAMDFWKQIEDSVNSELNKPGAKRSPQMFTSQTSVKTQVFLPSAVTDIKDIQQNTNGTKTSDFKALPKLADVSKDDVKRKSTNLEEALDELEAIYNSLRLGDEDLLDRAEQREKENAEKKRQEARLEHFPGYGINRGALSDSSFSYEPFDQVDSPRRKRTNKKNKIPDTKEDDMYNRKLIKEKSATISDPQSVISSVSYLLASPLHVADDFGKEFIAKEKKPSKEPDITFDDVVYRNVKHANSSLKLPETQPPFGIPLGPIAPAPNSDYLHAVPENVYKPSFKPRKMPDIVKDDLAFRNLRKDHGKEPILPLLDENTKQSFAKDDNLNYLKKKRAMRSLSANVGALVGKNKTSQSEDVENEFKTLTDIADAMEIARKVLQEKGKKITETKKAFMSDTDAYAHSNETLHEKRQKFLNSLKNYRSISPCKLEERPSTSSRPPKGLTPERKIKESTPIPKSPLEDKTSCSTNSSLDDFLNALAQEAKETTDRISKELKLLREDKEKRESLNRNVVDSTKFIDSEKNMAEEEVEQIDITPRKEETANVIVSCDEDQQAKDKKESVESDHDYENLVSDKELNVDEIVMPLKEEVVEETRKCQSPFEEHKAKLIASFQELKHNVEEIPLLAKPAPLTEEKKNDADKKERHIDSVYDNLNDETHVNCQEGEPNLKPLNSVVVEPCDFPVTNSSNTNHAQCELTLSSEEDEASSGFHSNCSCVLYQDCASGNVQTLDSLESLKSPKLVLESCKKNAKLFKDGPDKRKLVTPHHSSDVTSINGVKRANSNDNSSNNEQNGRCCVERACPAWHNDPSTMVLACFYGIACLHLIASIDFVAIFGIVLAVISFIAAVLL